MKGEKRDLLASLAHDDASAREAVLHAGTRVMRWRRRRRMAWQSLAGMAAVAIAVLLMPKPAAHKSVALAIHAAPPPIPGSVTDDELLKMFPNTPIALITLKNGRERFIFLNPKDQRKFMGRL